MTIDLLNICQAGFRRVSSVNGQLVNTWGFASGSAPVTTAVISWNCGLQATKECDVFQCNSIYENRLDLIRALQFTDLCPSVPRSRSIQLAGIRT